MWEPARYDAACHAHVAQYLRRASAHDDRHFERRTPSLAAAHVTLACMPPPMTDIPLCHVGGPAHCKRSSRHSFSRQWVSLLLHFSSRRRPRHTVAVVIIFFSVLQVALAQAAHPTHSSPTSGWACRLGSLCVSLSSYLLLSHLRVVLWLSGSRVSSFSDLQCSYLRVLP